MLVLDGRFEVVLVFPTWDKQAAEDKPEVREVLKALGSITLGASTYEGIGYWQPTDEVERAVHIYAAYDKEPETLEQIKRAVFPVVAAWAVRTDQQAVAFEVDGTLVVWDTPELVEAAKAEVVAA